MKIVIAPGSSKESLSTEKCCQAVKAGFSTIFSGAHYIYLPIADGGGGTVDAMIAVTGGNIVTPEVCRPMGETVNALYGLAGGGRTAVTEVAAAGDLVLVVSERRNPLLALGFGTGGLIRHVLDNDIRHIILGIGGSATIGDGMDMTQVFGVRLLGADGRMLAANGGNLARMASIEMDECDPRLTNCRIEVVCDVDNPLVGIRGTTTVFGPQKRTTPEMVEKLEWGLRSYARILQQQTEINVCQIAGSDAVGGMGITATVFLNADIKPGIEIMLNAVSLAQAMQSTALMIIGEGRIDSQTADGKVPLDMMSVAKQFNVPVIGIAGVLDDGVEVVHQYGIDAVFNILSRLISLVGVLASGETNLFNSARNIAYATKIGQGAKN